MVTIEVLLFSSINLNLNTLKLISLKEQIRIIIDWGHSSVGRAPAWHAGGQRFESAWFHLIIG